MAATLPPLPTNAPLLELGLDGKASEYLSSEWYQWLFAQASRVQQAPPVLGTPTRLTAQGAAIGVTSLTLPALNGGIYRVSWTARITQAATVSSSLTVSIGYTETALSLTQAGAAITGNTTTTVQSGVAIFQADPSAPITFSTAFASVGATPMLYRLSITCEQIA